MERALETDQVRTSKGKQTGRARRTYVRKSSAAAACLKCCDLSNLFVSLSTLARQCRQRNLVCCSLAALGGTCSVARRVCLLPDRYTRKRICCGAMDSVEAVDAFAAWLRPRAAGVRVLEFGERSAC